MINTMKIEIKNRWQEKKIVNLLYKLGYKQNKINKLVKKPHRYIYAYFPNTNRMRIAINNSVNMFNAIAYETVDLAKLKEMVRNKKTEISICDNLEMKNHCPFEKEICCCDCSLLEICESTCAFNANGNCSENSQRKVTVEDYYD